jgi:hypothetical protein
MNIKSSLARPLCASFALLAFTACGAAGQSDDTWNADAPADELEAEASDDAPALEPFASFESKEFGKVQFFEPEQGELLVSVVAPEGAGERANEMHPVELYEQLAGESLPERFAALSAIHGEDHDFEDADADPGSLYYETPEKPGLQLLGSDLTKENISEDGFISKYCSKSSTRWCWPSRTNTSYYQKRTDYMWSYAYPYVGTITHRLQRKNTWGNWKTLYSHSVPTGYTSYLGNVTGPAYTHESKVYDASGDAYHHSGGY